MKLILRSNRDLPPGDSHHSLLEILGVVEIQTLSKNARSRSARSAEDVITGTLSNLVNSSLVCLQSLGRFICSTVSCGQVRGDRDEFTIAHQRDVCAVSGVALQIVTGNNS